MKQKCPMLVIQCKVKCSRNLEFIQILRNQRAGALAAGAALALGWQPQAQLLGTQSPSAVQFASKQPRSKGEQPRLGSPSSAEQEEPEPRVTAANCSLHRMPLWLCCSAASWSFSWLFLCSSSVGMEEMKSLVWSPGQKQQAGCYSWVFLGFSC